MADLVPRRSVAKSIRLKSIAKLLPDERSPLFMKESFILLHCELYIRLVLLIQISNLVLATDFGPIRNIAMVNLHDVFAICCLYIL